MIPILKSGHEFLKHDSFVDCSQIQFREKQEIINALKKDANVLVGKFTSEMINSLLSALKYAPTIKGKVKKRIGLFDQ